MTTPYYTDDSVTLYHGQALDVLRALPDQSVDCVCTSPPYFGLRDYGVDGQLGLEASPAEYVEAMRAVFAEVRRVLADDGTLWLNLGDSYSGGDRGTYDNASGIADGRGMGTYRPKTGVPAKNLLGIPWRVAFALQDDGWILRNAVIWSKPNAMPESVTDRLSTRYEHVFLFSKSRRYWFDLDPIREDHASIVTATGAIRYRRPGEEYVLRDKTLTVADRGDIHRTGATQGRHGNESGRNPGDVWTIPTSPFPDAHFAVMPRELARRCIASGCKPGGTVLDPFSGSGTTGLAATSLGRRYVGIDLSAEYLDLSLRTRLAQTAMFEDVTG